MTEIQELREIVQAQAARMTTLTRLVERMGSDLNTFWWGDNMPDWPYTVAGQREYEAAMHEAEGAPETRESTGAWGYE